MMEPLAVGGLEPVNEEEEEGEVMLEDDVVEERRNRPEDRPVPSSRMRMGMPPRDTRQPVSTLRSVLQRSVREVDQLFGASTLADGSRETGDGEDLEDFRPGDWEEVFDRSVDVSVDGVVGSFRCYLAGEERRMDGLVVCLHGGGHGGMAWGLMASRMKSACAVLAYDARGHGATTASPEKDLSTDRQMQDCVGVLKALFGADLASLPPITLLGHSMGGAIAVRICSSKILPTARALAVIDVVEGTAIAALPYMQTFLMSRPKSFMTLEKAVQYVVRAGQVKNVASARLSVPAQLHYMENAERFVWRTDLEATEKYWRGWFEGLSKEFLSAPVAKLLILAGVDRLDKDLTIAQMQGKFQTILIAGSGHSVHEDEPDRTAQTVLDFLRRNRFLPGSTPELQQIFQQRDPIPPCC